MRTFLATIGICIFILAAGCVEYHPLWTVAGMIIAGVLIHPAAEEERNTLDGGNRN